MKKTKRFFAALLAALMLTGIMTAGATAAAMTDSGTVTITNAVAGVTYKFYRILDISGIANDGTAAFITNVKWHSILKTMNETTGSTHYGTVHGDDVGSAVTGVGNSADGQQLAAAVLAAAGTSVPEPDATKEVTTSGEVNVEGIHYVYYIVESTREGATQFVKFTLKADTLSMKEKNDALPQISKKVNGEDTIDADFNTVLNYTITITAAAGTDTYTVTDALPSQIDFVTGSLSLKSVKGTAEANLVENTDYTLTTDTDETNISIVLKEDLRKSLADGDKIVISYQGKLIANTTTPAAYTNSAKLAFNGTEEYSDDAKVFSGHISFAKKDNHNNYLAGASFVLKNGDGQFAKLSGGGTAYSFESWVTDQAEATTIVTGSDIEYIMIRGLKAGTYTLVETAAPEGYVKGADTELKINKEYQEDANKVLVLNGLKTESKIVINTKGSELPGTGGIGSTIFYTAGGLLVLGAVVLFIVKRRKTA